MAFNIFATICRLALAMSKQGSSALTTVFLSTLVFY